MNTPIKIFQKYASKDKSGCISYPEFHSAWKESGMPEEDTKAIFDAVVSISDSANAPTFSFIFDASIC